MAESATERPKLRIVRGKRRKFEPPTDVNIQRVVEESGESLLGALESKALQQPVSEGTDEVPSFEEHAEAKDLEEELGSKTSKSKTPEDH